MLPHSLSLSAFQAFRDTDGLLKVRLYNNTGNTVAKGSPMRWIPGTSGRDEVAAIVASLDAKQVVCFAEKAVPTATWGLFVVDGPIVTQQNAAGLETVTVPSAIYTAGNGLRVDPFSAALQDSGVPFDMNDESQIGEIVATATGTSIQVRLYFRESIWRSRTYRRMYDKMENNVVATDDAGYGDPTGSTGDVNLLKHLFGEYEYHVKGTGQTILAPVWGATGLNVSQDLTNNEGVEYTNGITALSRFSFTVGTDSVFFKLKIKITDVSGSDQLIMGFRKQEAYQADWNDYDELVSIGNVSGDIKLGTILNNAATVVTDTTDNWADGATKTLEVYVSKAGVVTYKIDGAAPTVTAAFTFDNAEKIIPFFFLLHDTDVAESTLILEWQCGIYAGNPD
jgi:hypothetical protein